SSQTWNHIYARKPLFGLMSALTPIHETWKNDKLGRRSPKKPDRGCRSGSETAPEWPVSSFPETGAAMIATILRACGEINESGFPAGARRMLRFRLRSGAFILPRTLNDSIQTEWLTLDIERPGTGRIAP
ncbi:hypothetical protein, partial [Pseudochelatococcus contaminans]